MSATKTEEFYAQLLPLEGDRVLLPAAAIREGQHLDRIELNTGSPAWLLGFTKSMGERLPVVSLEGLMGKAVPAKSAKSRIIRVVSMSGKSDWMLLTQGQPHLTPLNEKALVPSSLDANDPVDLVLCRTRIANLVALIPDLEEIEKQVEAAIKTAETGSAADWQPGAVDQPDG